MPRVQQISAIEAFPLRRTYLRPMLLPERSRYERDEHPAAYHWGAFDAGPAGEELIAAVSFLPGREDGELDLNVYQLQGMITRPDRRNAGVGMILVERGIAVLEERGVSRVWCNGRTPAASFYQRLGFRAVGEEFMTPGTGPHYLFVRDL